MVTNVISTGNFQLEVVVVCKSVSDGHLKYVFCRNIIKGNLISVIMHLWYLITKD